MGGCPKYDHPGTAILRKGVILWPGGIPGSYPPGTDDIADLARFFDETDNSAMELIG